MAQQTLTTKIVVRNDSSANWSSTNPVLSVAEFGYETDTKKFKIGDGVSTWTQLKYAGTDEAQIQALIDASEDNVTTVTAASEQDDAAALATISEPKKGDIGIVKRLIAADKYTHSTYVYSGTQWEAADGSYDATNVYFGSDLTATSPIGVITIPSTGSATIPAEGKSLDAVLRSMLATEKTPTITQPTATLNSDNIGTKEVGTNIAIQYSFTTNQGSYQYGPATGVTFSGHQAVFNGETLTGASGTFASIQVTDDTNLTITSTVNSSVGAMPVTNLGNEYPAGQIQAKTLTPSKGTLRGYRGWFYGYKNGSNAIADPNVITSAEVRALGNGPVTNLPSQIDTNQMKQIFFAIPKGLKSSVSVADATNGAPQTVTKITDVMVEGADGYAAIEYDVWYVNNAAPASGSAKFNITVK